MSRALVALPLVVLLALAACGGGGDDGGDSEAAAADPGQAVFAREGCGSCHAFAAAGSKGGVGPDLDAALEHHTEGSVKAVVLDPPAGTIMPDDFRTRISDEELDDLASFLVSHRGSG